jgi:tetraacyldisaccharide 4'-kinase
MIIVRLLLLPFALLYACIIALRNMLYQTKIVGRTSFDIPIICVGNISVGGTGKTPHTEWIIRLLKPHYHLAVLSRGYKRKTTGYVLATPGITPEMVGDEPYQIAQKFPDVAVGVSENRVMGVPYLLGDVPQTQVVIMDDGFQHLPIKPGYSVILTDYSNPFYNDWIMPSGTLREFRSAYKRAQCIIVTKCPASLSEVEKQNIIKQINPQGQLVLFSYIQYDELVQVYGETMNHDDIKNVLAFSGIAKHQLFIDELKKRFTHVNELSFADHKHYDSLTFAKIVNQFKTLPTEGSAIITTEKDAVKLNTELAKGQLGHLPVFYLPISIGLSDADSAALSAELTSFIRSFEIETEA